MRNAGRILLLVVVALPAPVTVAHAGPAPCATATDPFAKAAIAAAEVRWATHWMKSQDGWLTAYALKPEPKNPLGIAPLRLPTEEKASSPAALGPITGIARFAGLTCQYYEVSPEAGFIIRYVGRNLTFSDNGGKFSPPIASALIEALAVTRNADPALTDIAPLTEARTAIDPDMTLSLPPTASPSPSTTTKRR